MGIGEAAFWSSDSVVGVLGMVDLVAAGGAVAVDMYGGCRFVGL